MKNNKVKTEQSQSKIKQKKIKISPGCRYCCYTGKMTLWPEVDEEIDCLRCSRNAS